MVCFFIMDKIEAEKRISGLRTELNRHRYFYPHTNYVLCIFAEKQKGQ